MFERTYRQRLETDLARWQAEGVISPANCDSIRNVLKPLPKSMDIATVIAIAGGLLIAAAFLAFVAANWTDIARPFRFVVLLAGIAGAYAIGGWFAQRGRTDLSDLSVSAGSIIFGAAIALVGQMYHLSEDFAGGMLLWAGGALVAAVLTSSRGALAVALVAACMWSGMRVFETSGIHFPFLGFWLVSAGLALTWNAPVARHLVALAAIFWWTSTGIALVEFLRFGDPTAAVVSGGSLMLGGGLALATRGPESLRSFGVTLSSYGALALALSVPWLVTNLLVISWRPLPEWIIGCAVAGTVLAFCAAVLGRRIGPAFAGLSLGLALVIISEWARPVGGGDPWLSYALGIGSMLCLVISGMLDDARTRVVAGWIGLASVIGLITWSVKGSLLRRAAFLGVAGGVAVALASLLGRLVPKERTP